MNETQQAEAILDVLNAAVAPAMAYEYGKVPGSNGNSGAQPHKYLLVDLSRRYVEKRLASGEVPVIGGRLGVRYVAKATNDARTMRARVTAALEDQIITTEAGEVGPFCFESAEAILPDDGYQSGADVFTF